MNDIDIRELCEKYNIPYIKREWQRVLNRIPDCELSFKKYCAIMKLPAYRNFTYEDTDELNGDDTMNKYRIIALVGKAGAGKDYLMRAALSALPGLHEIVTGTTRPPREGEQQGKEYWFMSDEQFEAYEANGEMLETTIFNNWHYGTPFSSLSLEHMNIAVVNPEGVRAMLSNPRVEVYPIFVDVRAKTRLLRQLDRELAPNVDEIIRRYSADEKDFENIDFDFSAVVRNESAFDAALAVQTIRELCEEIVSGQNCSNHIIRNLK